VTKTPDDRAYLEADLVEVRRKINELEAARVIDEENHRATLDALYREEDELEDALESGEWA
jgi:hypothetical protein